MEVKVHTYRLFSQRERPLPHGSFTRSGGVSPLPYDSLNVGKGVGDDPELVAENRRRIGRHLGCKALLSARQVHGSGVYLLRQPINQDLEVEGYDALVSPWPGVGLMIQQADCQAVLLHDPRRGVTANIHVGWRGSVANIIGRVVTLLVEKLGCRPVDLLAAVSPSLGPCCAEFVNYRLELPLELHPYRIGEHYFDFWAISRAQLEAAGVEPRHIETAGICTRCHPAYFSYRRDGLCGRNASVIAG